MITELLLPMPPSLNALWINLQPRVTKTGRVINRPRVRSKIYKQWIEAAGWELLAQKPKPIAGNYDLTILLSRLRKGSDLANREKAISDLLQRHGVIENDSLLRNFSMRWDDNIQDGYVKLILEHAK